MPVEIVTLTVGGTNWTAWTEVTINASIKDAARSFSVKVAAEFGAVAIPGVFKAGEPCEVRATGTLVLKGHIDRRQSNFDKDTAQITISGRSKSADLVDNSALHKTGRFKNKKLDEIGKELDTFGVGITADIELTARDYQLTPGETVFRALEKLARKDAAALMGEADGSLKITNASKAKRHAGGLVEGRNIKAGESDHDWSKRPSKVIIRGQRAIGHGPDALEIEQDATDSAVTRDRPQLVVSDDDTTKKEAKKRAEHGRDRAAGNALKATITVVGWRDEGGELWTPNRLIWTESPFLDIAQDMLVETVTFTQSRSGGTITRLGLVDPRAHKGKKGKGNKSKKTWDQAEASE